jgi:hypothetical protein
MNQQVQAQTLANSNISQLASEIQSRISVLEGLFAESLDGEMDALKACIIENPSAAALLKDEDVGLLVKALRRTVSVAATEAAAEKKPGAKKAAAAKVKLTPAQIQAALDEEGF